MEVTPNHTQAVSGWAAMDASGKVVPFSFMRRETGVDDVAIKVQYCGMCHTDLHFINNDWGITMYPVVPGHEITGVVTKVGTNVSGFRPGDRVGVGCIAASCLDCDHCRRSEENYCDKVTLTYNGILWDGSVTYGGYSDMLVAHKRFLVKIPDSLPLDAAAPLLCAGITVYSPMKQHGMLLGEAGRRLGVVGLGGLGHVAVKFGKAFGLRVTVISTSPAKEREARENLKADDFVLSTDDKQMQAMARSLDYVIDTVSAQHSLGPILELLKVNGKLVLVAAPDKPVELPSFPLIFGKRTVSGSMTGGMKETQEMMDLCGKHNITCDIELVSTDRINEALTRLACNDVRYRFVVDIGGNGSKL
ncbi:probable cinnamyl alcohol dehydrogenase 6 [Lolium rigidum]|uniref:probable cinnamyl alcohol dehydrogenase 6 n=1 Tax=Lolium rigidum TaxID=89674 RepID=UPI001F5E291E|nr:probable cinnamyl alcohol dehydrogenase 6 [Lolium rigidum]